METQEHFSTQRLKFTDLFYSKSMEQNPRSIRYAFEITRRCGREFERPLNRTAMKLRLGQAQPIVVAIFHNILYPIERAAHDQVFHEALKKSPERFQEGGY